MKTMDSSELGKRGRKGSKFDEIVTMLSEATMPKEEGKVLAEDVTELTKQPSQVRQFLNKRGLKDSFKVTKHEDRVMLVRIK